MALPPVLDFVKDPDASPARMNRVSEYLVARYQALETPAKSAATMIAQLQVIGLTRIADALAPVYAQAVALRDQLDAVLASYVAQGLPAADVVEGADLVFLTAARRAAILSDALAQVRDGVDPAGDSLAKVYALVLALKGNADAAHDSLGDLAALIDTNAAAIITKADAAATATALGNRLRGDAAGNYTDAVIAQFLANLGLGPIAFGQCRLVYTDAQHVTLQPFGGGLVWINGAYRRLPAGGVALANTGLAGSTSYYVYAAWNGTVVTPEVSTTGRATDATWGHQIKSGDPARTLVGMVYTDAAGNFVDTPAKRWVASWFARVGRDLSGGPASPATASTSSVELTPANRVSFLAWADDLVGLSVAGYAYNGSGSYAATALNIDGASVGQPQYASSYAANVYLPVGMSWSGRLSEGVHYASVNGSTGAGTASWNITLTGGVR